MKHLKVIVPIILLLIVNVSYAQVGETFPAITGESLQNNMVELPSSTKGKFCLVGLASSQNAELDLQSWMQPVFDMFIHQNTFIPIDYNLDIYFMPMFTNGNQ